MANARSLRSWDAMWEKLQRLLGFSGVESPFGRDTNPIIDEPMTLYVETTGNDSNPGTKLRPFLTIQAALDSLKGREINQAVEIKVGVGEFDGFFVPPLNVGTRGTLTISGTMVAAVGVTSNTGIQTNTETYSIAHDTNWNLTTNELEGRFLAYYATSTTATLTYAVIYSNTATQATLLSTTAPYLGRSFQILDCGTKLKRTGVVPGSQTAAAIAVNPTIGSSATSVTIRYFEILDTSGISYATSIDGPSMGRVTFTVLRIPLVSSLYGMYQRGLSSVSLSRSYISTTNASAYCMHISDRSDLRIQNTLISGTGAINQHGLFFAQQGALYSDASSGVVFKNLGKAIHGSAIAGASTVSFIGLGAEFVGCTNCIDVRGFISIRNSRATYPNFAVQSSGNTNFILARGGVKVSVGSTVTSGIATNDITMQTANPVTTHTLTQMRANTPQAITDQLGTVVGADGVVL